MLIVWQIDSISGESLLCIPKGFRFFSSLILRQRTSADRNETDRQRFLQIRFRDRVEQRFRRLLGLRILLRG